MGTQKFHDFDRLVLGLVELYLQEHPRISVKGAIRAVVEETWNRAHVESEHDFYKHEQIGASPDSACARIFARFQVDITAEVYHRVAQHIEKRS